MSTTCVAVPARPASRSITAVYATTTAITFATVAGAPTPIYRLYRETLALTPFTITFIYAVYSFTMIAAFLTIARLSDYVGRKPMILLALGLHWDPVSQLFFWGGTTGGGGTSGGTSSGNVVAGNYIGTDYTGGAAVGNAVGVRVDSAPHTLVGGLTYGIVESFATGLDVTIGSQHISGSGLQDALALIVLLLVLIFRPRGIMGKATA